VFRPPVSGLAAGADTGRILAGMPASCQKSVLDEMAGKPSKTPKKPDTPPAPTASKLDRRGNPVKKAVQLDMFDKD